MTDCDLVRSGTLRPGDVFETALTKRVGIVLDRDRFRGIPFMRVLLDRQNTDRMEEKGLASEIRVRLLKKSTGPSPARKEKRCYAQIN